MRQVSRFFSVCILTGMLFIWDTAFAQSEDSSDQTLAPYFFIPGGDEGVDRLPLKSTRADVTIAGVIAEVKVVQVYRNEGSNPIEATYVFPASTRATVHGLKMRIGARIIEARIRKRDQARQEYEQAFSQGRSATLLEQQRPNVFQMNVANIMPGDEIMVELAYTELVIPTDKVYEFAYPTVVGPRYSNRAAQGASLKEAWVKNPYLHQGQDPTYDFDITVNLNAGMPISSIASPSHGVKVAYRGPASAVVTLDPTERRGGNRDYILRYRLDGDKIQTGLILSRDGKENHFLLMLQPPKQVRSAAIPAREYIFIVDVSGSMHGFPLDISKRLMGNLISGLKPTDRFNVLLFSGGSAVLAEESLSATPEHIAQAISFIDRRQGGGGTELLPAMRRALALKRAPDCSRTLVIATDGYVSVEEATFDLIRGNLGQANLFAFGIGSSVNRHLIEGMAHVGKGEPFIITNPAEAAAKAERFRRLITSPMLTHVKLEASGFDAYDIEPKNIPDVLSERPVIVFGKWRGEAKGTLTISGLTGEGVWRRSIVVDTIKPSAQNAALRYLWARERIALLADYNQLKSDDKRIKEVTDLGLRYNLLTAYTSFVAVDSQVRNQGGNQTSVAQPLPLPQGVSDYAVGGNKLCRAMSLAPSPSMAKEEADLGRDAIKPHIAPQEQEVKTARRLSIPEVTASRNLSEPAFRARIQALLPAISGCLPNNLAVVTLEIELTIKTDGSLGTVSITSEKRISQAVRQCIERVFKQQRYPIPADGKPAKAQIIITVTR